MDFGSIANVIIGTLPAIGVLALLMRQVNHRIGDTNSRIIDANNLLSKRIDDTNALITELKTDTHSRITEANLLLSKRIDDTNARITELRTDTNDRITELRTDTNDRITELRTDTNTLITELKNDLLARLDRMESSK